MNRACARASAAASGWRPLPAARPLAAALLPAAAAAPAAKAPAPTFDSFGPDRVRNPADLLAAARIVLTAHTGAFPLSRQHFQHVNRLLGDLMASVRAKPKAHTDAFKAELTAIGEQMNQVTREVRKQELQARDKEQKESRLRY